MTHAVMYEKGIAKHYIPTEQDLNDMEEFLGAQETATDAIARGLLQGAAFQAGFMGAQGLYSALSGSKPLNEREIILCKSHKVHSKDIKRMEATVADSERRFQEAEALRKELNDAYGQEWFNTFNEHLEIALTPKPEFKIKEVAGLTMEKFPRLWELNQKRIAAETESNWLLTKWTQENTLLHQMKYKYKQDHKPKHSKFGTFMFEATMGFVTFIVNLYSKDF